jgi:uncharacterized Zn ribbon protein
MIIVTEDLPNCPRCEAPAVKDDDRRRHCNSCGLAWERKTEADELDDDADRLVRSRGFNEKARGSTTIGRGQTRW